MNVEKTEISKSGKLVDTDAQEATILITAALSTDFAEKYKRAYRTTDEVRHLKRRLYVALSGIRKEVALRAYQEQVYNSPAFMPSVASIVAGALAINLHRRQLARDATTRKQRQLPKQHNVDAQAELAKIKRTLVQAGSKTQAVREAEQAEFDRLMVIERAKSWDKQLADKQARHTYAK